MLLVIRNRAETTKDFLAFAALSHFICSWLKARAVIADYNNPAGCALCACSSHHKYSMQAHLKHCPCHTTLWLLTVSKSITTAGCLRLFLSSGSGKHGRKRVHRWRSRNVMLELRLVTCLEDPFPFGHNYVL